MNAMSAYHTISIPVTVLLTTMLKLV